MAFFALKNAALGIEQTKGTAVEPTRSIPGVWTINTEVTREERENVTRASLARVNRSVVTATESRLGIEGDATFELLAYLFTLGINGSPTVTDLEYDDNGTQKRAGTSWDFTPNHNAPNNPKTATIVTQDENTRYVLPFAFVELVELSFALNSVVTLRSDLLAHYPADALDPSTGDVVEIPNSVAMVSTTSTVIEIDVGNTGTYTALDNSILSARLRMPTGLRAQGYLDGGLNYNKITEGRRRFELELEVEQSAEARAGKTAAQIEQITDARTIFEALTIEQDNRVRITHTGTALADGTARKLVVEMYATPIGQQVELLANRDDRTILPVTLGSIPARAGSDEGQDILSVELICDGDNSI